MNFTIGSKDNLYETVCFKKDTWKIVNKQVSFISFGFNFCITKIHYCRERYLFERLVICEVMWFVSLQFEIHIQICCCGGRHKAHCFPKKFDMPFAKVFWDWSQSLQQVRCFRRNPRRQGVSVFGPSKCASSNLWPKSFIPDAHHDWDIWPEIEVENICSVKLFSIR